jgi:hypothetical protein
MLVLSRVVGELISIGDDISLRVLSVNGPACALVSRRRKRSMCTVPKSTTESSANSHAKGR